MIFFILHERDLISLTKESQTRARTHTRAHPCARAHMLTPICSLLIYDRVPATWHSARLHSKYFRRPSEFRAARSTSWNFTCEHADTRARARQARRRGRGLVRSDYTRRVSRRARRATSCYVSLPTTARLIIRKVDPFTIMSRTDRMKIFLAYFSTLVPVCAQARLRLEIFILLLCFARYLRVAAQHEEKREEAIRSEDKYVFRNYREIS